METVNAGGEKRITGLLRPVAGAVVGGAAGAVVWAVVSLTAQLELGWIAWGVGVLAGFGARAAAGATLSSATGMVAAGAAVVSIAGAKVAVVHVAVDRELAPFRDAAVTDELATSYLADEVVEAWEAAGRELVWPVDSPYDVPQVKEDYPPEVWDEAASRFEAMDAGEREDYRQALVEERADDLAAFASEWRRERLRASLGPVDLVFLALAVATAFRIARGSARAAEA